MHSYEMCHLIAREKTYTLQAFKEKVSGKIYEPKKNVTGIWEVAKSKTFMIYAGHLEFLG